ncbi:MAG: hypothetical protein H6872_05975 [Methylobacteriaceae bacterium]|nr:hypothetical protein [Methylobacteriaceae bacterium]
MLKIAATLLACVLLAGCSSLSGSRYQENPIGVGSGPNTLKQSPCACMTLPNDAAATHFKMS